MLLYTASKLFRRDCGADPTSVSHQSATAIDGVFELKCCINFV